MSFTSSGFPLALTLTFVVLVLLPTHAYAFGAGEIPDFSYLNGANSLHFRLHALYLIRQCA